MGNVCLIEERLCNFNVIWNFGHQHWLLISKANLDTEQAQIFRLGDKIVRMLTQPETEKEIEKNEKGMTEEMRERIRVETRKRKKWGKDKEKLSMLDRGRRRRDKKKE